MAVQLQAHLNLRGLGVAEAKATFDAFLWESVRAAKRMVLVVHGRGLFWSDEPVLKNNVRRCLTRGPWRSRVGAFRSARGH